MTDHNETSANDEESKMRVNDQDRENAQETSGKACRADSGEHVEENKKKDGREELRDGVNLGNNGREARNDSASHDELVQKKVICALAYLFGILFFLPLAVYPNDEFAKFHANQSLVILLISVIGGAAFGLLSMIPAIGIVFAVLASVFSLVMLAACILGILGVVRLEKYELPVIGKFRIIK